MNVEQLKKSGYIIHECIVGSHLYGTNKEGSDIDIKGVFVLPTDKVLSGQYIEQVSDDKQDTTYYEIGKFIELATKANPNILDVRRVITIIHINSLTLNYAFLSRW